VLPRHLLFAAIVLLFLGSTHVYLGWRLGQPLPGPRRRRVHGLTGLSFLLMPALLFAAQASPGSAQAHTLSWLAFVHMGLFTLVLSSLLGFDLGLGLLSIVDRIAAKRLSQAVLPTQPERRRALLHGVHLGLLGLAGAQGAAGAAQAARGFEVKRIEVPVTGLHPDLDGFRIAQVTDLHLGPTIGAETMQRVVEVVNGLEPDLVAITGDLVDGSVAVLGPVTATLTGLRSRHGTWFCTGNHEYYSGVHAWVAELRRLGITVLNNEHRVLQHGDAPLVVAGVTDLHAGETEPDQVSDVAGALERAPADAFRLLLAHRPESVYDAAHHDVDLQLSGHTHGGQYFPGTLLVKLAHPYVRGLHRHAIRTWIYVSCGTGFWGPPFRLGTTAEVTEITLRRV